MDIVERLKTVQFYQRSGVWLKHPHIDEFGKIFPTFYLEARSPHDCNAIGCRACDPPAPGELIYLIKRLYGKKEPTLAWTLNRPYRFIHTQDRIVTPEGLVAPATLSMPNPLTNPSYLPGSSSTPEREAFLRSR